MEPNKRILLLDFCNYEDYPIGGYLTRAKNFIVSFGEDLALVGITTDNNDPVGRWFKKNIGGSAFDYFAFAYYSKEKTKHIIPDRLITYLLLKYYKKRILKIPVHNIFIQRQEVLQSVHDFGYPNICYCFAGLENPLSISKYRYAHYLAAYFEKGFFGKLQNVQTILAAGDNEAILDMVSRSKSVIKKENVIKFPSRINTDIFYPLNKSEVRSKLNISQSATVILSTGRLSWLKGWKFMLDCFLEFNKNVPDSLFYLIGEGEDSERVQSYIIETGLTKKVILAGKKNAFEVADYLNSSDLFIMGSYKEGWSTALLEAIACGIPACVTNFSSAKEIVFEGRNGYVVDEHNTDFFVNRMHDALKIKQPIYNENVKAYATNRLKEDLLKHWELL